MSAEPGQIAYERWREWLIEAGDDVAPWEAIGDKQSAWAFVEELCAERGRPVSAEAVPHEA